MPSYKYANDDGLSALAEGIFDKIHPKDVVSDEANPVLVQTEFEQIAKNTHLTFAPQQDLHGYDHPWPAGGGKNLVDWKINRTANALSVSLESGTYTMSSSEENTYGYWYIQFVDGDGNYITDKTSVGLPTSWSYSTSSNYFYGGCNNRSFSFLVPANCSAVKIGAQTGDGTMPAQLEKGSEATAYEPYSNICPISGLDTAEVKRTGKNLLPISNYASGVHNGVTWTNNKDGSWTANGTAGSYNSYAHGSTAAYDLGVLPAGTYTASLFDEFGNVSTQNGVAFRVGTGESNAFLNWGKSVTFTMDGQTKCFLAPLVRSGSTVNNLVIFLQLELGSTATTYEPYQEQIVEAPLPETVYGGTLDLETGELVVDRASVDLGTLNWSYNSTYNMFATWLNKASTNTNAIISVQYVNFTNYASLISDTTKNGIYKSPDVNHTLYVRDTRYTDADTFKTAMSGVQLVYELATPITYTLTPKQLALLKGTNHISTNASTVKVTFRAGQIATLDDVSKVSTAQARTETKLDDLGLSIEDGVLMVEYDDAYQRTY